MNQMTDVKVPIDLGAIAEKKGMTREEAAYMRGGIEPVAGSFPMSTSKYLNSPLYVHAFTTMALRRYGRDLTITYDIPNMSRGIADIMDYAEGYRLLVEEREKNPMFAEWLERRTLMDFRPEATSACAPGTLGAAIHDFISKSGMEIEFVHKGDPRSDLDYIIKRTGQTHDVQHMLTGFAPNLAGEHALATMNIACNYKHLSPAFANFLSVTNAFVQSSFMVRAQLHYPEGVPILFEATRRGIEEGNKITRPLFMVNWEDYFDWQMDDIAADLGFDRGPGTDWDFSEDLLAG